MNVQAPPPVVHLLNSGGGQVTVENLDQPIGNVEQRTGGVSLRRGRQSQHVACGGLVMVLLVSQPAAQIVGKVSPERQR